MPYELSWMIDLKVIYLRVWGIPDLSAMHDVTLHVANYLDAAQSKGVPIVVDLCGLDVDNFRGIEQPSKDIQWILGTVNPSLTAARRGLMIVITTDDVVQLLASAVNQVFLKPMITVQTIKEAIVVLRDMFPHLHTELDRLTGC